MRSRNRLASILALCLLGCSSSPPPDTPPPPEPPASTASAAPSDTAPSAAPAASASASASATAAAPADTAPSPPADEIGKSNQFAARAFVTMAKRATGNAFVSPTSLRLALGMTLAGAEGKTAEELATALGLDTDPAKVAAEAKAELASWKALNGKDVEMDIANRLWGDKSTRFEKAFLDTTREGWGAALESVDFHKAPEPARKAINAWVKKETKDKIPEILPAGSVTEQTRLVLTNAIYFNGKWTTPFDKGATKPGSFNAPGAAAASVPMMHRTGSFKYGTAPGVALLELPYGKGDIAMVIALPDAPDGLARLEADLSYQTFSRWRDGLRTEERVEVSIPSFEFSFGGSVKEALMALGITRAFSDAAELGKMARGEKLQVTDVFHKTYVKVDEAGTEAAAATGVVVGRRAITQAKQFVADHPFLFYLHDTRTGRVLFVGHVQSPASK